MRKDRILERDHRDYVKAERDVLTAVVHPYIVTLRYSFQVQCGGTVRCAVQCAEQCVVQCAVQYCVRYWWDSAGECAGVRRLILGIFEWLSLPAIDPCPPLLLPPPRPHPAPADPHQALPCARLYQRRPPLLPALSPGGAWGEVQVGTATCVATEGGGIVRPIRCKLTCMRSPLPACLHTPAFRARLTSRWRGCTPPRLCWPSRTCTPWGLCTGMGCGGGVEMCVRAGWGGS